MKGKNTYTNDDSYSNESKARAWAEYYRSRLGNNDNDISNWQTNNITQPIRARDDSRDLYHQWQNDLTAAEIMPHSEVTHQLTNTTPSANKPYRYENAPASRQRNIVQGKVNIDGKAKQYATLMKRNGEQKRNAYKASRSSMN